MVRRLAYPLHHVRIIDLDGEFATMIEAARRQIDRSDHGLLVVSDDHLRVQFEVLEGTDIDSDVVENTQSADPLDQLALLQSVWSTGHHTHLHATAGGPNQALDDHRIPVTVILHK